MMEGFEIDHADIVVTHTCNMGCKHCIDGFVCREPSPVVSLESVDRFMRMLSEKTEGGHTVLLLGGEPTTAGADMIGRICDIIHDHGFRVTMSTNGVLEGTIRDCLDEGSVDTVQITVPSEPLIQKTYLNKWWDKRDRINVKIAGDWRLNWHDYICFRENVKDFYRKSVSMYFTPEWRELCTDRSVWKHLNELEWKRNGSYLYAFDGDVRIKRCIPGMTNVIGEPTIPKLYPNGNYNMTWRNEDLDDYLNFGWGEIDELRNVAAYALYG